MPGAAKLTTNQLKDIAQNSMGALSKLGAQVQWVDSQVTDNKSTAHTSPQALDPRTCKIGRVSS
jgi:hypothetical protein